MPKHSVRNSMLQFRRQLSEAQVQHRSFAVESRLQSLDIYRCAETVALYSSVHNEVSTATLLRDILANRRSLVMPKVCGDRLEFRRIRSLDDLTPGCFGILEPGADAEPVGVDRLDLIVVPGVAFDRRGHRLGYGKGFYDRALGMAESRASRVGLGYDFQLVESLPVFAHDVRLDLLVTETEVLAFGRDRTPYIADPKT